MSSKFDDLNETFNVSSEIVSREIKEIKDIEKEIKG